MFKRVTNNCTILKNKADCIKYKTKSKRIIVNNVEILTIVQVVGSFRNLK